MPLKWKIFFALNFVLSIPALVYFIFLFVKFINSYTRYSDYVYVFLFLFALLMITLNGFLNIYMLQRFFPDKLVPQGIKTLNTISLVINILVCAGILILSVYVASFVFSRNYIYRGDSVTIAIAVIFFLWVVQVVVLIMQGQLPGRISRNNREKMSSLIDSIGQ